MNCDTWDAVETIIRYGAEAEAIRILAQNLDSRLKQEKGANAEMKASLRAIRKINRGENKAIDALTKGDGKELESDG